MASPDTNYSLLIQKLDEFIRRYYLNKLVRGSLYAIGLLILTFITINVIEYYFYLPSTIRSVLFILFILANAVFLYFRVILFALKYYRLGTLIDRESAAVIIGDHFPEVSDKLLNTLQLQEQAKLYPDQKALIEASINQKILQLKPIPFSRAIDLSRNKRYLKYALVPVCLFMVILFTAPSMITESTNRFIHFSRNFEKPAPFLFELQNKNLKVIQGDELDLRLQMSGEELPQDIYLLVDDNRYKLEKSSIRDFNYTLKNIQKSKGFRFFANGFYSKEYQVEVSLRPSVLRFRVQLNYPAYLKRSPETMDNIGDLTIPEGTQVNWTFYTEHTEEILFNIYGKTETLTAKNNKIEQSKKINRSSAYYLLPVNKEAERADSIAYSIQAIPDLAPSISVEQRKDSLSDKIIYFSGQIRDDHGFSRLQFSYKKKDNKQASIAIPINKDRNSDRFFYYLNLSDLDISAGEQLDYYFEVWDNDGVNGPKSARSATVNYEAPTLKEISRQAEENNRSLKDKMQESVQKAERIQKDAKKLNEKLLNKKSLSFDEKKQVQDLMDQQKELEKNIEDIKKQNEINNLKESDFKNIDPAIAKKKKELEDLFENVLDPKTKELIKQLEKLMEQNNKEKTQEQLKNMQLDNKQLEKEMDRMLELFKQLEFDQKLNESIDRLEELSKRQEQLSEESKKKNADTEALKKQQDELNKEIADLKKDLEDLEKKNNELENPENFENPEKDMQDIQNDMQKSSEDLGKNKAQKASDSQKKAADQMKNLSSKMKSMKMQAEADELDLNIKALRDILENLVKVSFDQEKTMEELKKTSISDPYYLQLTQKQRNLKDDMKMIEDSIYALSKKVAEIRSFVNKEIGLVNSNAERSIQSLADRRTADATMRQQYVMTSVNNLAVMLSEILQQMQAEKMSQQSGKSGNKPKPGKKPGGQSLSKMQEQLNKQIQEMQNGMKPGQKPGKGEMSEQMARMAAQQQAIRNALNQLEQEMNKNGQNGNGKELNQLKKEMEKTESDLYNKNINPEMINRQKEIMTRLLETEKALREREYDNKREAESGKEKNINFNAVFEEYKKQKMKELELYKTVPPSLNPYYKEKVNRYFEQLK